MNPLGFIVVTVGFCVLWGLGLGLSTCLFWAWSWHQKAATMRYPDLKATCHQWVVKNAVAGVGGIALLAIGVYGYLLVIMSH